MERINFLNCPVDNVNTSDALNWMDERIRDREAGAIAVVNANKYWHMSKDERLRHFVQNAELIIPEWAVFWGSARLGTPLKAYVAGVALLQAAMPWAEKKGYRPYFLGAKPDVIRTLANRLKSEYPKMNPAGFHHGYLKTEDENQMVRDEIAKSSPDMVFVAMGSPRQEYWMAENAKRLHIPVCMGVGGSFDVLAGIKKDTPAWARGNGMEWLYRLAQDPKMYWKRYLICNPWFIQQVFLSYFRANFLHSRYRC